MYVLVGLEESLVKIKLKVEKIDILSNLSF